MFRPFSNYKPLRETVNFIMMNGGVGDHIGTLVVFNYVLNRYKHITPLFWVPDFMLDISKNVLPSHAVVRSYSQMPGKYDRNRPTKTTQWDQITSPMKIHAVDYSFLKLCDELPGIEHRNYLKVNFDKVDISHIKLPEKYVVVTTGYTAKVREFHPVTVNGVVEYLLKKGYTPVFLGQDKTPSGGAHVIQGNFSSQIDYSKGEDLRNKTTLPQAAKIIQGAKAIVGVDNGLLHVAGCTDTPIVAGFTTVDPMIRAPIRDNILGKDFYPVVPDKSLNCRFCQSNTNFLYEHDYTKCIYKDYACVPALTVAKFIEQLEKILT